MKLNHIRLIIIFLSFHLILNNAIQIENFNEIFIKEGTTNYTYQYPGTNKTDGQNPYFLFKFSPIAEITLKIIDEDNNTVEKEINNPKVYIDYKLKDLKPQNFTFVIHNKRTIDETLIFIDNSNEINTNLEKYFILVLVTDPMEDKPRPLIFNFEPIEFRTIIYIKEKYSIFEYCKVENNECNYTEVDDKLIFEKGDKIKFK